MKKVRSLEVESKDIKHGHITRAVAEYGVTMCMCCGRTSLRGDFPSVCRETCAMSNKGLNRRDLLSQAMGEEAWYNKRGKHKQQRDMQEFMLRAPMQDSASRMKRVEDTEEMARNKQRARGKMSERMKRVDR